MPKEKHLQVQNKKRRAALALGATGIVAFFVGKLFSDHNAVLKDGEVIGDARFKNFRISEDNNEMIFADKSGDPIIIIDKASFRE